MTRQENETLNTIEDPAYRAAMNIGHSLHEGFIPGCRLSLADMMAARQHIAEIIREQYKPHRENTKHVAIVNVIDPDTCLECPVEIRKTESGVLVGFDGAYLEALGDEEHPFSPYEENTVLVIPDDEHESQT